jgi:hypothetical protein
MRGTRREQASSRAVEAVRRRFEDWRRDAGRSRRIPEELWRVAVDLAAQHGIWRTARALRLNNAALKQRLVAAERAGATQRARLASFVELPSPAVGAVGECVVELEDRIGTKLRVRFPGWTVPDLAALAREFRRSEP